MNVLVACESSGVVRRAFRDRGHNAWSCDILPADDGSDYHIQSDILAVLESIGSGYWSQHGRIVPTQWDLMIAHPPCTYLSVSGLHWNGRVEGRAQKTEAALDFVRTLMAAPIARKCIENPLSCISTRIRKSDQVIQPYQFGHDASKETHLWLFGLPHLVPTKYVKPRMVGRKPRWANQTDSGQNKLPPSETRWKERSETYAGIAEAMAEQWGDSRLAGLTRDLFEAAA